MTTYKVTFASEPLLFSVRGEEIICEYDISAEKIAAILSGEFSNLVIFLIGARALLRDIKAEAFVKQCQFLHMQVKNNRYDNFTDPCGVIAKTLMGDLYFLYGGLTGASASIRHEAFLQIKNPKLLSTLLAIPLPMMRLALAGNPSLSEADDIRLASANDWQMRYSLASKPNLKIEALFIMASFPDGRAEVMMHKNATDDLFLKYAQDPDHSVRESIANRTCDLAVIAALAKDPSWSVRHTLLFNSRASNDIKELLSQDPNPNVRWRALKTLGREVEEVETESIDYIR